MDRDKRRVKRIKNALRENRWDALVCTLPMNVLMLSGYWPFVGAAVAIATREGKIAVLAPDDAKKVVAQAWPDELETFQLGSLNELKSLEQIVRAPLTHLLRKVGLSGTSTIAYEDGPEVEPSTYAAMNVYGAAAPRLLAEALPGVSLVSGSETLSRLRSVLTERELNYVREACKIVNRSYQAGRAALCTGLTEIAYCMSGPNSASAYAAYQRSTNRAVECGDFTLIHCNSFVNGFWTDFTRTFCIGKVDQRKRQIYDAILDAHHAAIRAIRPGVCAAEVDRAARQVLTDKGFGENFKHAAGHGVGFVAISHLARPRIHPKSDDVLEPGMVFNLEPSVYLEGYGGVRHCDMVTVTDSGAEVLTPFLEVL